MDEQDGLLLNTFMWLAIFLTLFTEENARGPGNSGVATWPCGDKYVGEFSKGRVHGSGTYVLLYISILLV